MSGVSANAIETLDELIERDCRPIITDAERKRGRDAVDAVEALLEAAKALSDFLENEKETREPPRELLDQGYVALETSADYEREEELGNALAAAVRRVESGQ